MILFGTEESNRITEGGWIAIIAGMGTLATIISSSVTALIMKVLENNKSRRVDALNEWKVITDRQQVQIDSQQIQITKVTNENVELVKANALCKEESATLKGEVRLLQVSFRRLQSATGNELPLSTPTIIVCDSKGTIRVVGPNVAPLLHWEPKDLLGKSVIVLIPENKRHEYTTTFEKMLASGDLPWPEQIHSVNLLCKDGSEVPISASLRGWKQDNGEVMLAAEIAQRPQESD